MDSKVVCADCGKECIPDGCTTGYGIDKDDRKICFACCGENDRKRLETDDRIDLYLTKNDAGEYTVSNWPGTLKIRCGTPRKGRHNIARTRYDVWFKAGGHEWHGVQYGENTQIVRCQKLKAAR